ncbi:MAG: hypothetical protein MJ252_18180 [archaeon]|nr:hypothetical protein [archaeon]
MSLINDNIYTIEKDLSLNENDSEFNPFIEFGRDNFKIVEYLYAIYFREINNKLVNVFQKSMFDYSEDKKGTMNTILILFIICNWLFSLYVIFIFMKRLTKWLLISRSVFKIIPTKIINKTKELEEFIEQM